MRRTTLILGATLSLATLTGSRTAFADDNTTLALAVQDPGRAEAVETDESAIDLDPRLADVQAAAEEMGRRRGALRACYERQLRHDEQIAGTVELRLTIGKSGSVRRVQVSRDQLGNRAMNRCLVSHLRGARFAPPLAGAFELAYPLRFRTR